MPRKSGSKTSNKAKPYKKKSYKKKVYKKKAYAKRSTFFEPVGRYLGGLAGSVIGGPAGATVGSGLGSTAGSLVSKITGFGSYHVNKNTLYSNSIPQFQNHMGDGAIRIRHKEFIMDVVSSPTAGLFNTNVLHISASDQQTFPYLSQLAINFEEFAFEGLVFEYRTSSGSLSTTGQLGTVIGAVQFNSLAQPYINKQQMEASTFGQSTVASQSCLFPVECDSKQTPSNGIFYNMRPGIINVNNDLRWSRLGNFTIATQGMPSASETVGELYVSYDVVLLKPILIQDSGAAADHWTSDAGIVAGATYFGAVSTITPNSDVFTALTGTTINFDPSFNGRVQITYAVFGGAGAWLSPTMLNNPPSSNDLLLFNNDTQADLNVLTDPALNYCYSTGFFTINSQNGVGGFVTLNGGTFFTPVWMDLMIVQIPADFD